VTATSPVFVNTAGSETVTLTLRNTGASSVTIADQGTVDGNTVDITQGEVTIAKGSTAQVTLEYGASFAAGAQYSLGLTTTKGNTIAYTATYNP
jgi:archaellum component FlaG (FlaF/FlaG flagellin family)